MAVIVRWPEHGAGCHSRDLFIDQRASFGWKQYGIAFDRQVSTPLVTVERSVVSSTRRATGRA